MLARRRFQGRLAEEDFHYLHDPHGLPRELVTSLDLLAPHVEYSGYGGYMREEDDSKPSILTFRDGACGLETDYLRALVRRGAHERHAGVE